MLTALLAMLLAQSGPWDGYKADPVVQPNPFDRFDDPTPKESFGPGPHVLMIADGAAITRVNYKTGPACAKARDAVRRQQIVPATPGFIPGPPRVKAFCVPL